MTRRIKRSPAFELTLSIKQDEFMRTPREHQRNWLLNRAMKEMSDELFALDELSRGFIAGGDPLEISARDTAEIADQNIMEDWQIPIMEAMADCVCRPGADILEVGFGRGVASDMIQARGPGRHTIIECNPHIVAASKAWQARYPDSRIEVIEGMWQDVTERLGDYDGIFFHTYPLNDQEYVENVAQSVTFAQHFFQTASDHLREGGAFTYLSNEADSLSRAHQRALLAYFKAFTVSMVRNLGIPEDSRDSHWIRQMIVVRAQK